MGILLERKQQGIAEFQFLSHTLIARYCKLNGDRVEARRRTLFGIHMYIQPH